MKYKTIHFELAELEEHIAPMNVDTCKVTYR